MNTTQETTIALTRADYADGVTASWCDSVAGIIQAGRLLLDAKSALPHGEFGKMFDAGDVGLREVPFSQDTAGRLMSIARSRVLSNSANSRNLPASWYTLYQCSKLPEHYLAACIADGRINAETRSSHVTVLLRQFHQESAIHDTGAITGTYRVIYADPPWQYGNKGLDEYGHAERHYSTMSTDELCNAEEGGFAANVQAVTAGDAVLFLWATSPLLPDALRVIEAWGFTYKTSFVWDKVRHNFGHYNSVRHELLLVATKGSCTPDQKTLFDSVVVEERTEHSAKPESFRKMIETLYTHGGRIELFRRGAAPDGWDVFGNQSE